MFQLFSLLIFGFACIRFKPAINIFLVIFKMNFEACKVFFVRGITSYLDQPTTSKNIEESKFRKTRSSFNLRFKLTKDENCEMVIFRFYCKIIRPSEMV